MNIRFSRPIRILLMILVVSSVPFFLYNWAMSDLNASDYSTLIHQIWDGTRTAAPGELDQYVTQYKWAKFKRSSCLFMAITISIASFWYIPYTLEPRYMKEK